MLHATRQSWSNSQTFASYHICLVTETYAPEVNGVALTLAHLRRGLQARGHIVSLVRPRQPATDLASAGDKALETLVYGAPIPGYQGAQMGVPAPGKLWQCWTRHRPDVVYIATEGPLGWSALRTALRLGIPVFSGFHTNFHRYAQHYRLGWLQPLIFAYLRWFHRRTYGTLVPSLALREQLTTSGVPNVQVLGRGVDSQLFTPARRSAALRRAWGVAAHELVVLYVGRLAPEKNIEVVLAAYRAMQAIHLPVKCVVVGDGPLRATLQQAHPELIFCGMQTGVELACHYASGDIFLFPSTTETFGNVTLEALASGLAVVAYNYAAAHRHITHGENGMLVPYNDAAAFVDAAVSLARAPQGLLTLRRQARAQAQTLDWQDIVEQFAALLTGALETTPDPAEVVLTQGV